MYKNTDKMPRRNYTQRPQSGARPFGHVPHTATAFYTPFIIIIAISLVHARAILLGPAEAIF